MPKGSFYQGHFTQGLTGSVLHIAEMALSSALMVLRVVMES
jgi:hypothetical protein